LEELTEDAVCWAKGRLRRITQKGRVWDEAAVERV
jgi:hypothetical protein